MKSVIDEETKMKWNKEKKEWTGWIDADELNSHEHDQLINLDLATFDSKDNVFWLTEKGIDLALSD